jgi:glyoxylase-like metal-dependent hydrolase (beta-lactamase superfamily II)
MRLSEHCYAVTGLGYITPWCVNAGFITGDERTLIVDTGSNAYAGETILGYAIAAKASNEVLVINTEKHFDHILGNCVFDRLGCEIWGHPRVARTAEEFSTERNEVNESIVNSSRRAAHEENAFFHGTELVNPAHLVACDTTFELGNCRVEILLTPGHTPTNLSVWMPDERVLFTGDCLISQYAPNLQAGNVEDWRIWLRSLARIETLHPEVVVAGHGPIVRGVSSVEQMIQNVRETLNAAIALA